MSTAKQIGAAIATTIELVTGASNPIPNPGNDFSGAQSHRIEASIGQVARDTQTGNQETTSETKKD